jgi:hypothetical protein
VNILAKHHSNNPFAGSTIVKNTIIVINETIAMLIVFFSDAQRYRILTGVDLAI